MLTRFFIPFVSLVAGLVVAQLPKETIKSRGLDVGASESRSSASGSALSPLTTNDIHHQKKRREDFELRRGVAPSVCVSQSPTFLAHGMVKHRLPKFCTFQLQTGQCWVQFSTRFSTCLLRHSRTSQRLLMAEGRYCSIPQMKRSILSSNCGIRYSSLGQDLGQARRIASYRLQRPQTYRM